MKYGEKYRTALERQSAYEDYCCDHIREGKNVTEWCAECPLDPMCCRYQWLDTDAPEEKPLDCPFCKHPTSTIYLDGGWVISCTNRGCSYKSAKAFTKERAIMNHNKLVKKIEDK